MVFTNGNNAMIQDTIRGIVMLKKKLAVFCALIVCSIFLFACEKTVEDPGGIKDTAAERNGTYWLCGTGIADGPDYIGGVCKVYFRSNAIVLEGKLFKSLSREDYGEQIGTAETYTGEALEIAADCKVVQDEGNEERAYSYHEYIDMMEISETDNVAGIYMAITVQDGKVTEIYYSA